MIKESRHRAGGLARTAKMAPEERSAFARSGAEARWAGHEKADQKERSFSMPMEESLRDGLERIRASRGLRSWSDTIRKLIEENDPPAVQGRYDAMMAENARLATDQVRAAATRQWSREDAAPLPAKPLSSMSGRPSPKPTKGRK